jgi:hypothetical protein
MEGRHVGDPHLRLWPPVKAVQIVHSQLSQRKLQNIASTNLIASDASTNRT